MVERNSTQTESDGTTTDAGRPSGASGSSPEQARRSLATPDVQTRPFDASVDTQGETRARRFSYLRSFADNHFAAGSRRRRDAANVNEAIESTSSDQGMAPSARDSTASETPSADGTEGTLATGLFNPANTSNRTTALDRFAITSNFAANLTSAATNPGRRSRITRSGSPSLALRVSADDGGNGARVNPRAGRGVSPFDATATAHPWIREASELVDPPSPGAFRLARGLARARASRGRGTPAAGTGAASDAARPANGSRPVRTGGAQAAGNRPTAHDSIPAGAALPAAGDVPAVGTMPSVGRVAYITVQSPDNRVSFPCHIASTGSFTNWIWPSSTPFELT